MLRELREAGVVGGGGAGFPTEKKMSVRAQTLLINAAECEPLLQSDQWLMLHETDALVRGADAMAQEIGAQDCVICLKDHYISQYDALSRCIAQTGLTVRLHRLPTVYPIGDEQAVIHSATGKTVPPLSLPGSVGCTVVSVSTAVNVFYALKGRPVTHRYVTVAGEIAKPGLYRVPVGTPIPVLIACAGGARIPKYRVMLGGPMMGTLLKEDTAAFVTKTCGGVLLLPPDHPLVQKGELSLQHMRIRAMSACIQCRACTDLCPRYLGGHPIYPHLSMRTFAMGGPPEKSALLCMECGLCELYACPMGLSPRRVQQMYKSSLRAAGEKHAFTASERHPLMSFRQVPSKRAAARAGVLNYAFPTPGEAIEIDTPIVCVSLLQHIGAPCAACVRAGDRVKTGQIIGRMAEGALGAFVHASIDGIVTDVNDVSVVIQIQKEGRP